MRLPGDILLVACYELGHQPLSVAWPAAFLERAGYTPAVMDLSVEPFDPEKVTRARFIAIAVPMHTALRLGVIAARRIRTPKPRAARASYLGAYRSWRRPSRRRGGRGRSEGEPTAVRPRSAERPPEAIFSKDSSPSRSRAIYEGPRRDIKFPAASERRLPDRRYPTRIA